MLEQLDQQISLTRNQMRLISVTVLCNLLAFYNLFLVGFVLAFIIGPWKLTYGQSATVLLASGLGAILGSVFWGSLADKIGRRKVLMATVINFSVASGILTFTPEHAWVFLAVFRFFVGFGVGGLYCVNLPLVQEFMPAAKRGLISGLATSAIPLGFGLGGISGSYLAPLIGWRGLFVLTFLPLLMLLPIRFWMPESPHWLTGVGRLKEAQKSLAWALQINPAELPFDPQAVRQPKAQWRELLNYPRSLFVACFGSLSAQAGIYGLVLWAPTLLIQVLNISAVRASYLMIFCGLGAFLGRVTFSHLSERFGRRRSAIIYGFGAAILIVCTAYLRNNFIGEISVFWLMLIVTYFFGDGGFAIIGPYAAEVWPSRLRAAGMGTAYGFGGLGQIVGPLGLALIVGSSNVIRPQASVAKILPAFCYLACWYMLAGILYGVFGFETKGRSISDIDKQLADLRVPDHAQP